MATAPLGSLARYLRTVCPESDAVMLAHFARTGNEEAFAELVRRHGPAVLGVCRRILRDGHAAEDAFQATFLLLAKKASSLGRPERLGCWLHGVARRTALKLRGRMLRRLMRERPFEEASVVANDVADADLGPALDAAIEQLPWKYRLPVVLCYLQGLTNAEAGEALGCPANTVATRLARARQRLRGRLVKQGLTAAVSTALVAVTARNAAALAAGITGPSTEILTLMEGVQSAMLWKQAKLIVAAVAILTLTGFGASRLGFRASAQAPGSDVTAPPSLPLAAPNTAQRIPPVDLAAPQPASKNFVVTGTTPELASEIALAAEKLRSELAWEWLGTILPNWPERCPIEVTITTDAAVPTFSTVFHFGPKLLGAAKNSDAGVSGVSTNEFRIGGMKLTGGKGQILLHTLPHEVTHTVLADHFRQPIPRWADEGAAALAEGADLQYLHDQHCRELLAAGQAMRLSALFGMTEFVDNHIPYVQGHSVTRFLVGRKDRGAFIAFVREGMGAGWDAAAKDVYGFRSVNELEEEWIASLRQRPAPKPIDPPLTPAPTPASEPLPPATELPTPAPPMAPANAPAAPKVLQVEMNVMMLVGPTKMLERDDVKALLPEPKPGEPAPVNSGVLPATYATRLAHTCREKAGGKLLAEPRFVTLSGRPATFQSGGQQPVPALNGVTYRPVGLEVALLPVVKENGRIYLEASPTLRSVNKGRGIETALGFVPGFDERSCRTAAELQAGETVFIRLEGSPSPVPDERSAKNPPSDEPQITLVFITPRLVEAPVTERLVTQPMSPPQVLPPAPAQAPAVIEALPPYAPATARPSAGLVVVQVSVDKEGKVVCKFAKTTHQEPVTTQQPGEKFPVTAFVRRTVQEERVYNPAQLRIIASDGKVVEAKDLPARLAKESLALFVSDGGHYMHLLPVLKDGTLLIAPAHYVSAPPAPAPGLPDMRPR